MNICPDQDSQATEARSGPVGSLWLWAIVGILTVALYVLAGNAEEVEHAGRSAFRWMVREWGTPGGQYSHGWLIPVISVVALWRQRKALVEAPKAVWWPAVLLLVAGLAGYWMGLKAQQTRVVLASFPLVVGAIPAFVLGRATGRLLLFPCAYLFFCVPLMFIDAIAFPLRLLAGGIAETVLSGIGIPVQRTGTAIATLSGKGFNIDVADPCSGLHSLMAMAALGAAYAFFFHRRPAARWLMFVASLPIAVAGNVVRVISIALAAAWFGQEAAMSFYHDYSGYVLFGAAVIMMMGLSALVARWLEGAKS